MPKYSGALSTEYIKQCVSGAEQYKRDIKKKVSDVLQAVADKGKEICLERCSWLHIHDSGKLMDSIEAVVDVTTGKAFVRANCDYAVFVEFGTGLVGERQSYPNTAKVNEAGYIYNGGAHHVNVGTPYEGWYYPKHGVWIFTQGYRSRPFMLETAEQLKEWLNGIS